MVDDSRKAAVPSIHDAICSSASGVTPGAVGQKAGKPPYADDRSWSTSGPNGGHRMPTLAERHIAPNGSFLAPPHTLTAGHQRTFIAPDRLPHPVHSAMSFVRGTNGSPVQHEEHEAIVPWWSFTKTVLSAAALSLVRDGLVRLDDVVLDGPFTLRELLRHEAGC